MNEELYIIENGQRQRIDLACPSGITLNFKSNLFGDLSKITASYSYTFKLPMTANNRRVFESAEDVRCDAVATRKRLNAEFLQNGVSLFQRANLYLDNASGNYYNAVLTWGVVEGFADLKDNDISLQELPSREADLVRYMGAMKHIPRPTDWLNTDGVSYPYRASGIYMGTGGEYGTLVDSEGDIVPSNSMPVVPIFSLIEDINFHYGTKFRLGQPYGGANCWDAVKRRFISNSDDALINLGVVPFVKRDLTDEQLERRSATLSNFRVHTFNFWGYTLPVTPFDGLTVNDVLTFDLQLPEVNNYYELGGGGNLPGYNFCFWKKSSLTYLDKLYADGYFIASFRNIYYKWGSDGKLKEKKNVDQVPKFTIYKVTMDFEDDKQVGKIKYEEAATLEGYKLAPDQEVRDGYTYEYPVFEFDFRKENGMRRLEIEGFVTTAPVYPCFFAFSHGIRSMESEPMKLIPEGQLSDNVKNGFEMDKYSNLPDVSCFNFMKSLFYMMGAFPFVNNDGYIVPLFYDDIRKHRSNGESVDWSSRLYDTPATKPEKVDYKVSGFSQKNFYLLKNDDLDMTEKERAEQEDVYEDGMMCVEVDNNTLDKSRTVIQIPWYGPFLKDRNKPSYNPCRDVKCFKFSSNDRTSQYCESKPAIGMLCAPKVGNWNPTTGQYSDQGSNVLYMEVYNPFHEIDETGYAYLQELVRHPKILTVYLRLNEFDLRDIDYTMPIYLDRYNSFFAIVSISRDSKGKCKCELIKLP